ncbi:LmeA family phospholipid-binding protein [Gordonia sp. (in: high G+C Gram-positive bacteria)]|uniref:LmeA family phospholipid-binding protein n=1 Tax=Gordonia sp. (in: high G+C Gram-positive bacteria) TaxID=84139 RepID=UPI003F998C28
MTDHDKNETGQDKNEQGPNPEPEENPTPEVTPTSEVASTPDEAPTGEVVTGPIDQGRVPPQVQPPHTPQTPTPQAHTPQPRQQPEPPTHAYSQAHPSTKQMEAQGTGEFGPAGGPPTGPPPPPVTRSAPAGNKKRRRRTYSLVAVALVLVLIIAGVGTELYMRNKVTGCIENAFGDLTGASTEVSVSRKPMLLSVFGSDVPWVQVDTSDGDAADMRLHARAEGISTDGGTVKHLEGNGILPYNRITELSNQSESQGSAKITGITADENAGTIKVATEVPIAIISVPATVTLKPKLADGAVSFEVTDATALMFGLPPDFAQPIVDQVTESMFGPLFKQIKVDKFTVGKTGVDFSFAGDDVNMKAASESNSSGESSGGCSI